MTRSLTALLAYIPSPSSDRIQLGPFTLRAYGTLIALGALLAVRWAARRLSDRGGDPASLYRAAAWAIPAGIVGARAYHVATDYQLYQGRWLDAFKIWDGGLGIWGGVLAGVIAGWIVARRHGDDVRLLLDVVAPTIPLAQA
ncbi:MAG: prolipoprotein diacylglyceryl transferase, partial [Acidimicrobiales bacterium]